MTVEREHAWPSARPRRAASRRPSSPLMPPGFYYRGSGARPARGARSSAAWRASQGRATCRARRRPRGWRRRAANAARDRRARRRRRRSRPERRPGRRREPAPAVLLVEQDDRLGRKAGRRRRRPPRTRPLAARVTAARAQSRSLTPCRRAIGWYEEGVVAIDRRPDLLLVATGSRGPRHRRLRPRPAVRGLGPPRRDARGGRAAPAATATASSRDRGQSSSRPTTRLRRRAAPCRRRRGGRLHGGLPVAAGDPAGAERVRGRGRDPRHLGRGRRARPRL